MHMGKANEIVTSNVKYFTHYSPRWFREDNNARNGSREKKPRKAKTKMGERHHIYVWYDGSSKRSGGGQASVSQRHLGTTS